MSFFKDFKEDLSQAVNELMPEEGETANKAQPAKEEESPTQSDDYSDLFASFEDESAKAEDEVKEVVEEVVEEPEEEYEEVIEEVVEEVEVDGDFDGDEEIIEEVIYVDEDGNPIDDIPEDADVEIVEDETGEEIEEEIVEEEGESYEDAMAALSSSVEEPEFDDGPINTVTSPIFGDPEPQSAPINTIWNDSSKAAAGTIIKGMTVTGNIVSEGSLDVHGCVDGNIDVMGKLSITGKVQGDSKADEVFVNGARIAGGLFSNNSVKVASGSVIKGNIKASAAVVAGAVKGDIDVQGPVILDATAVIVGNIKSKSIQINNGAIIEGSCSQCYSDVTATNYFDEEE
ncbi:MAG: polymer-forming cytoskeletal protein [Lachnospiraceae bacterium]|nr:polymer-forming cytoskeletal protein [Lachnospiraceae bacterium]